METEDSLGHLPSFVDAVANVVTAIENVKAVHETLIFLAEQLFYKHVGQTRSGTLHTLSTLPAIAGAATSVWSYFQRASAHFAFARVFIAMALKDGRLEPFFSTFAYQVVKSEMASSYPGYPARLFDGS